MSIINTSRPFIQSLLLATSLLLPVQLLAANQYEQIAYKDQKISIYYPPSLNNSERKMIYQWLNVVTEALLTVYAQLPQDSFNIIIERSKSQHSPVPWGQVKRGSSTNVLLVINPDLGYEQMIGDWTAYHELSHLLLPYRGYGNIWFSEGLATYYQNIIQARKGLINETDMWNKITAGFERGKKDQLWNHISLTEVSDKLSETRQYMRVHWSGVLYWLRIDIALRKLGTNSLDDALKQLKACCETSLMSAEAIAHKLDDITKANIFVSLFTKHSKSNQIPEYKSVLKVLGVNQHGDSGHISLDDNAPLASIRRSITH